MSDKKDEYPVTSIHTFLQEASTEFRRIRHQAMVNLIGSIILLVLLSRLFLYAFGNYGPPLFHREHLEHTVDTILLLASTGAVLWSLYVLIKQRNFVSRWGERFEKLESLEKKLLPDEPS
jgi:hypothetical protein